MTIRELWHEIPLPSDGYEDVRIKVNYAGTEAYAFFEMIPFGDIEISPLHDRDNASTVGQLDSICGYANQMTKRVRMRSGTEVRVVLASYSETDETLTLYLREEFAWNRI